MDKVDDKKDRLKVQSVQTRISNFDNISCMELDFLKNKIRILCRLQKVESTISKEMIPDLIDKRREEKLNRLI